MSILKLKQEVLEANLQLKELGLVILTWGNVSAIDRTNGLVAIKPSGVSYNKLTVKDIVVLDLEGKIIEGKLRPSSDTPTHLKLYNIFENIGGICHTHSRYATIFSQAQSEIKCFGTTHADYFFGTIPITRQLTEKEVNENYEINTAKVIEEEFIDINYESIPGVLVASHAPFTWGASPIEALTNSLILEKIAEMAFGTLTLRKETKQIGKHILNKHYMRKHGKDAYYGQK